MTTAERIEAAASAIAADVAALQEVVATLQATQQPLRAHAAKNEHSENALHALQGIAAQTRTVRRSLEDLSTWNASFCMTRFPLPKPKKPAPSTCRPTHLVLVDRVANPRPKGRPARSE